MVQREDLEMSSPKVLFCAVWCQYHQFRGLPLDDFGENHEKSFFSDLVHIHALRFSLQIYNASFMLPIYGLYGFILCSLILAAK